MNMRIVTGWKCGVWLGIGSAGVAIAAEPAKVTPITDVQLGAARAYVAPKCGTAPTIDGKLDDWKGIAAAELKFPFLGMDLYTRKYGGEEDLNVVTRIAWDDEALYLAVVVHDDTHEQAEIDTDIWRHDSVQVSIDAARDRSHRPNPFGYNDDDIEVGWAWSADDDEMLSYMWHPEETDEPEDIEAAIAHNAPTTVYEAAIKWDAVEDFEAEHGAVLGMNVMANDSDDGDARKGWLEWTPGTARYKRPFDYAPVLLVDDAAKTPALEAEVDEPYLLTDDAITGRVVVGCPLTQKGKTLPIKLSIGDKVILEAQSGGDRLGMVRFTVPPGAIEPGDHELTVASGEAKREVEIKVWSAKDLAVQLLDQIEEDLPIIGVDLTMAVGFQLNVDYARMAQRIMLRLQEDAWRDQRTEGQAVRAAHMAMGLRRVLDHGITLIKDAIYTDLPLPDVPHYQTGPIKIDGRSFVANTYIPVSGEEEDRPVFFNGYGHFDQVVKDLAEFHELGANIIQIEVGPAQVMPAEGKFDPTRLESHVLKAIKGGESGNVAVNVLVSPHYFPQWALDKWPALKNHEGGFFKHTVDAPQAKKIQEDFLGFVLPKILEADGHESLHSFCLSNEPVSVDSRKDAVSQAMWKEYLADRHKDISTANKLWGTDFPSFDAVPIPAPETPKDPQALPLFYDWTMFNMTRFAAWHAWEADVIKKHAPNVPVHAKIMPRIFERHRIARGVDPERFAAVGAINGNDCWANYDHDPKREWTHDWQTMNTFLDLQWSMAEAPIFNSENHIIRDRDFKRIPPAHTSTVLWQQAIHGQCAGTTWVWERTDDPKSDAAGSILHRPEHIYEHGRSTFDLNRLSKEVTALQNGPRQVALLYSVASIVNQPRYVDTLKAAYTALNFAGVHIGYRSEGQIAAGKMADTKVLIVPAATHVPAEVVEGLAKWQASGGKIVVIGKGCLANDPYGRPIAEVSKLETMSIADELRGAALRDPLVKVLDGAGVKPLAVVTDLAGKPVWGVEYRTATYDDKVLVNIVNLTRKALDLQINGGKDKWTNLRTERWMTRQFRLPPQQPTLVAPRDEDDE